MAVSYNSKILEGVENILQNTEKDDILFLVFLLLGSAFYHKFMKERPDPYHHLWFERPQRHSSEIEYLQTKDISKRLDEDEKQGVIFWGSQSGTAEMFANRLARECRNQFGLHLLAADLSDYDPETISKIPESKFAIFILSTYGEGDPSDNAASFVYWLSSNNRLDLSNLRYVAFGLGNSKYKFYNCVIDVITQHLNQCDAKALMHAGKADDAEGGTEDDFMAWKDSLFELFVQQMGFEERAFVYEPTLNVIEDTSLATIDLHTGIPLEMRSEKSFRGTAATSSIECLPVTAARKLLSTEDRNFIHLEVDIGDFPEIKYKTGDHLAIWPSNPVPEVDRLLRVLGLESSRHTPLLINSTHQSSQVKIPSPTTWEALFRNYLEISAPITREILLSLAKFAKAASTQARLKELGEDKDMFHSFCSKTHTNFGRILEYFYSEDDTWASIPLSFVLESLAILTPRYYSISSSSIVSPKRMSITVATKSSTKDFHVPGLTSSYISAIEEHSMPEKQSRFILIDEGAKIYGQVRPSKFRLPVLAKNPVIMICAGSGIAPFRGFMAERVRLSQIGREVGKTMLFFGCRNEEDYIYRDECDSLCQDHMEFLETVTAFSRASERFYVQDKIEQRQQDIIRMLLEQGSYIYICGSSAMARDVTTRLGDCMMKNMNWKREELESWLNKMRKTHKWQEDVWG